MLRRSTSPGTALVVAASLLRTELRRVRAAQRGVGGVGWEVGSGRGGRGWGGVGWDEVG